MKKAIYEININKIIIRSNLIRKLVILYQLLGILVILQGFWF